MTAIYVRVSTEEQAKFGLSVSDQISELVSYCERQNLCPYTIYNDAGLSGRKRYSSRPELVRMLDDAKAGNLSLIIFTKLDRLSRSVRDWYEITETLDRAGVRWRTTRESYETETADGRFRTGLAMLLAEEEADRTSERIRRVFQYKIERGEWLGEPPTGYKRVNKKLVFDPDAEAGMRALFKTYLETRSPKKSMEAAALHGVKISSKDFAHTVKKQVYAGKSETGQISPAYITMEQHQSILETASQKDRQIKHTYLFSGICRCGNCRSILRGSYTNGWQGYSCTLRRKDKNSCKWRGMSETKLEALLLSMIQPELDRLERESRYTVESDDNTDKLKSLRQRQSRLKDLYLMGDIERDEYTRRKDEIEKEITKYAATKKEPPKLPDGWRNVYNALDAQHKREFWRSIIKQAVIYSADRAEITFR